jgi:1-phosphofructokinase family hexose kinase
MILTLTPNPTIDRTTFVRDFRLGAVVRAEREVVTPSGKGVDASLVIHELGGETVALGLNAGLTGDLLVAMLDRWGIAHDLCAADGETRVATVLVDLSAGDQSTISASSLRATAAHLDRLLAVLDRHARRAWGLICGGSLPPGMPADGYARLLRRAREHGLVTLLDTSGGALRCGVAGHPHVIKVNRHELVALAPGMSRLDPRSPGDVVDLAIQLDGVVGQWASDALVITLGGEGALGITNTGTYYARPPRVSASNTAGAGDALSGGLMLARSRGGGWPAALAWGTAAAASVVMNDGTAVCHRRQVETLLPEVRVWEFDGAAGQMCEKTVDPGCILRRAGEADS